jgi:hypothetical protein
MIDAEASKRRVDKILSINDLRWRRPKKLPGMDAAFRVPNWNSPRANWFAPGILLFNQGRRPRLLQLPVGCYNDSETAARERSVPGTPPATTNFPSNLFSEARLALVRYHKRLRVSRLAVARTNDRLAVARTMTA